MGGQCAALICQHCLHSFLFKASRLNIQLKNLTTFPQRTLALNSFLHYDNTIRHVFPSPEREKTPPKERQRNDYGSVVISTLQGGFEPQIIHGADRQALRQAAI